MKIGIEAQRIFRKNKHGMDYVVLQEIRELQRMDLENEYYVSVDHPMEKGHYISFLAAVSGHGVQLVKLYPEGSAEARFRIDGVRYVYAYCNRHGLYRVRL